MRLLRESEGDDRKFDALFAIAPLEWHAAVQRSGLTHIVMHYDPSDVIGPIGIQRGPSVVGLSGGGMFRFYGAERAGLVVLPRLAAITLGKRTNPKVMIGVRIDVVLSSIDLDRERRGDT